MARKPYIPGVVIAEVERGRGQPLLTPLGNLVRLPAVIVLGIELLPAWDGRTPLWVARTRVRAKVVPGAPPELIVDADGWGEFTFHQRIVAQFGHSPAGEAYGMATALRAIWNHELAEAIRRHDGSAWVEPHPNGQDGAPGEWTEVSWLEGVPK